MCTCPPRRAPGCPRAFTLVEMIIVIAIIGVLAGLILPALWRARAKARETECLSDLKQIGYFLEMYRQDHTVDSYERNPPRLTHLYDAYVKQLELFLCTDDRSKGGEGGKPPDCSGQYEELDEPNNTDTPVTTHASSYMYEFAGTECTSWGGWASDITLPSTVTNPDAFVNLDDPAVVPNAETVSTWEEVKYAQMRYGDVWWNGAVMGDESKWCGYPPSRFPVIRCFWHADDPDSDEQRRVMNLSYAGHVFKSGAKWEWTALNP